MKVGVYYLKDDKKLWVALTYIFGIGRHTSFRVIRDINVSESTKVRDLTEEQAKSLLHHLRGMFIESHLRNEIRDNIITKIKTGRYQGQRHLSRLPVRGQRTSTNGRTNRYIGRRF